MEYKIYLTQIFYSAESNLSYVMLCRIDVLNRLQIISVLCWRYVGGGGNDHKQLGSRRRFLNGILFMRFEVFSAPKMTMSNYTLR